jgi:exosortase C (VPDSG-CTERM-specific)
LHGSNRNRPRAYAAFLLVIGLVFGKPVIDLINYAAQTHFHSHILLIPFISAYLIFIQRHRLPKEYAASAGLAAILFLLALVTVAAAQVWLKANPLSQNDYLSLMVFGFVCSVLAGGFLFLGSKWMLAAAFPLSFLFFMVPLPERVVHFLETASQAVSTEAAALLFAIAGTPMLRNGPLFALPGITIEVAQECSGMRSTWVLFMTTLLASYLFLASPSRRAVLIAFVIPLAIVRNAVRIWVIGFLCVEFGPQMIHSFIHNRGGPLFFALSLVPLFLVLIWLRQGETPKVDSQGSPTSTDFREKSNVASAG